MEERLAEHAAAESPPPPPTPPKDGPGGPSGSGGGPSAGEPAIWSRNFKFYFVGRSAGLLSWAMLPVAVAAGLLIDGYGLETAGYSMAFLVAPFAASRCSAGCWPTGSPPAG
ncbi:Multidrug efflux pump Tap OS=Streptomyces cyaneofuscatus OX=66883 GN=G3I52_18730 PE=3 SV=1 [Streptomyces cyaneofuscatus]